MNTTKNSQEQERDDHPGKKVNAEGIILHTRISTVGIGDARAGNEYGRKREPESAVGRERCTAEKTNYQRAADEITDRANCFGTASARREGGLSHASKKRSVEGAIRDVLPCVENTSKTG